MAELKWQNITPTENGWYWLRSKGCKSRQYVVQVMAGWVHSVLAMQPAPLKDYSGTEIQWYGPICPPG